MPRIFPPVMYMHLPERNLPKVKYENKNPANRMKNKKGTFINEPLPRFMKVPGRYMTDIPPVIQYFAPVIKNIVLSVVTKESTPSQPTINPLMMPRINPVKIPRTTAIQPESLHCSSAEN